MALYSSASICLSWNGIQPILGVQVTCCYIKKYPKLSGINNLFMLVYSVGQELGPGIARVAYLCSMMCGASSEETGGWNILEAS